MFRWVRASMHLMLSWGSRYTMKPVDCSTHQDLKYQMFSHLFVCYHCRGLRIFWLSSSLSSHWGTILKAHNLKKWVSWVHCSLHSLLAHGTNSMGGRARWRKATHIMVAGKQRAEGGSGERDILPGHTPVTWLFWLGFICQHHTEPEIYLWINAQHHRDPGSFPKPHLWARETLKEHSWSEVKCWL